MGTKIISKMDQNGLELILGLVGQSRTYEISEKSSLTTKIYLEISVLRECNKTLSFLVLFAFTQKN